MRKGHLAIENFRASDEYESSVKKINIKDIWLFKPESTLSKITSDYFISESDALKRLASALDQRELLDEGIKKLREALGL